MGRTILKFEPTPNPNAIKCWLDRPISTGPRSFRSAAEAEDDPVARALFEQAGVTNVFFCGDWMTINKPPESDWSGLKKKVEAVLAALPVNEL